MGTGDSGYRAALTAAVLVSAAAALLEHLSFFIMPANAGAGLVILSFFFDVLFTSLFISDFAEAAKRHKIKAYMLRGRGLTDFFGSVPLFLFFSGPSVIIIAAAPESAAAGFMKTMTASWSAICITGVLRVSRLARFASLPVFSGSLMTERHVTFICNITCCAILPAAPFCSLIMRKAGVLQYADALAGFTCGFLLLVVLGAVTVVYSRHFENAVSSVADALDRGFRRREFYLKVRLREESSEEGLCRIGSFYNESYLPAKIRQNINSPEPAVYSIPEDEVKNFIRNRQG